MFTVTDSTIIPTTVGAIALDHLYAITAMEAVPASGLVDDITDRIAIADEVELDYLIKAARLDGRLGADDLDLVEESAADRREALAEATRAARRRTRQHLHEPRPPTSPEDRIRVRRWHARIKADRLAGHIGSSYDAYLQEVAACRSVAQGNWCLYADEEMGRRINASARTVRRHRATALERRHLEVRGRGKDRRTNAVRPILHGLPVYLSRSEKAGQSATSVRLTRPTLADELTLTESSKTESPPLPPTVPAEPAGEGVAFGRIAKEVPQAPTTVDGQEVEAAADDAGADTPARQAVAEPAEAPATRGAPTPPPTTETTPATSAAASPSPAAIRLDYEAFQKVWQATGRVGREGYALAQWAELSPAEKVEAGEDVSRPDFRPPDMWSGKFIKHRIWKRSVPAAASASTNYEVFHQGTPRAAVLERLRGPQRWMSGMRTVAMDEPLREALGEVAP